MNKVAVFLMDGFEEIEALTVVDVLRRLGVICDIVAERETVCGSHGIEVGSDVLLQSFNLSEYAVLVLPGGLKGAKALRDSEEIIKTLKAHNERGRLIAAICAAPMVLEKAELLQNKNFTAYPSIGETIKAGNYKTENVVVDNNIITGRGPATSLEFAFAIAKKLGIVTDMEERAMLFSKE